MDRENSRDVLVVDDNEEIRFAIVECLRDLGLEVDTAGNGREALEHLSRTTYAVVLLDYQMPEMDGLAVVRELQQRTARPIVLMMTGFPDIGSLPIDGDVVQAILQKPFDVSDIGAIIKTCVDTRREHKSVTVTASERVY